MTYLSLIGACYIILMIAFATKVVKSVDRSKLEFNFTRESCSQGTIGFAYFVIDQLIVWGLMH